ncbi:hypothetical protein [Streptomyces millisiae]|uniref:ESX-1 secretion-associated protein n=1 Tax=Streptomyces millisiae TaxID=3075542 RepID=A0ABU2LUR6_9ACTN|nr:hypothetical protein [Streptomyces sp. DSM 44918]MDT0321275.1 hypothetical protein [Streptomyces sp. DSM 44918]
MSDDPTQYLPEQFRVSAGLHHESADLAESLSRLVGRVAPAAGQFGGAGAAGFTAALGRTADERARAAQRAGEDRDATGEGATGAAALGEETDGLAATAVGRGQLGEEARRIADGM